jgi:hypothetical protein
MAGTSAMPYRITCPWCKRLLDVPDGCEDAPLLCPGCQKEVVHPARQDGIQVAPVAVTETKPPSPQLPLAPTSSACRECGVSLEVGWVACPYCGNRQDAGWRSHEDKGPDPATILLAFVGAFGLLGLTLLLLTVSASWEYKVVWVLAAVMIGGPIVGIAFIMPREGERRPSPGRVALRALAAVGAFLSLCLSFWVMVVGMCMAAWNSRF